MSNNSNNIYNILGKLQSLEPKAEPKQAAPSLKEYAEVPARGSVLEGVNAIEAKLNEKYMGFKNTVAAIKKGGSADNPEAVAAAIGRKKYGKAAFQKAAAAGKKMGEEVADEGNAFGNAVRKAKADGIQPGEKINVGGQEYPVKENNKVPTPVVQKPSMVPPQKDPKVLAKQLARDNPGDPVGNFAQGGKQLGIFKEQDIEEVAAPGQEGWIKANKQRFIDQYGKDKGLSVLYATAWKRHHSANESVEEGSEVCDECGMVEAKCGCDHDMQEGTTTHHGNVTRHTKTDFPGYPADDIDADDEENKKIGKRGRPRKATTVKPRVDPNAPKKGRGRPKKDTPAFAGAGKAAKSLQDLWIGKMPKTKAKGTVVKGKAMSGSAQESVAYPKAVLESRINLKKMIDETHMTLDEMLETLGRDIKIAKETGVISDLLQDCMTIHSYGKKQMDETDNPTMAIRAGDVVYHRGQAGRVDRVEGNKCFVHLKNGNMDVWPVLQCSHQPQNKFDVFKKDVTDIGRGLKGFFTGGPEPMDEVSAVNAELNELAKLAGLQVEEAKGKKPDADKDGIPDWADKNPKEKGGDEDRKEESINEAEQLLQMMRIAGLDTTKLEEALAKQKVEVQDEDEELANEPDEKYFTIRAGSLPPGEGDSGEKQMNPDRPTFKNGDNALSKPPVREGVVELESKLAAEYESIKKSV